MKHLVLTHPGMILLSDERDPSFSASFSSVGRKIIQTNSELYKVGQEVGIFDTAPMQKIPAGLLVEDKYVYGIYFDEEIPS